MGVNIKKKKKIPKYHKIFISHFLFFGVLVDRLSYWVYR